MLGKKKKEEVVPPLLGKEIRTINNINLDAYRLLGSRYLWYNKIRGAKKSKIPFLDNKNLEEQMQATRAALTMVGRNINNSLILAFNSTLDSVKKANKELEGLPTRLEVEDRNHPPKLNDEGDALIIAYMPLRFLNLAKVARDKGKGIDFYAEGLTKKFAFKVLAYYCDPANWHTERLAYNILDLPEDAPLADINSRLAPLKTELELFPNSFQLFKFGKQSRSPQDSGSANTLDETFNITTKELMGDLFLQSFIINGMAGFLFRYYLTLITAIKNPKAYRSISNMFLPAMAKAEEMRIRFQASFMMEKEKIRIRQDYQEYYKEVESLPLVETVKVKGREVRKINYSHRLQDLVTYQRQNNLNEKQIQHWHGLLKKEVIDRADTDRGPALLMEILSMIMKANQFSVDGKLEVVASLRKFSVEQEKMGLRQLAHKKKAIADAKRKKVRGMIKFKTTKQFDMVKVIEKEIADLELKGNEDLEKFEAALASRKEAMDARSQKMEETAVQEGEKNLGRTAGTIYSLIDAIDEEKKIRGGFVSFILNHIQQENDHSYHTFYKNIYTVVPDLYPTEKIVLREALASKIELEPDEMKVSPEEMRSYQEQIDARVTELNMEAPQTLENRLVHGPVNTTLDVIMDIGLNQQSLSLLLNVPVNLPNKPAVKLQQAVARKLLALNQLKHPFPKEDIILTNVEESAPPIKRLNFNRLSKLY